MANAKRDQNFVPAIQGVSSVDLFTPTDIAVNPTTNAVKVETSITPIPNVLTTGTINNNSQSVIVNIPAGVASVGIQITGTWSGTIAFQGSTDGFTWAAISSINGTTTVTSTTSNGLFVFGSSGLTTIRCNSTAWSSGSANISANSTVGAPAVSSPTVSLAANSSVNVAQIAGNTTLTGNGTTGTGSQRVTIASDNTAFSVNATLSAETTKVIGTVNQGTSPWIVAGGGTAGVAALGVITVQGIASMTKLLVTPDSVALPANQSVNMAQWGATTLGTPTNFGTTPTAVIAGSVNASLFAGTTALTQTSNALDVNLKTIAGSLTLGTITTVSTVTNLSQIATVVPTFGDVTNATSVTGNLNVIPVGIYNTTPASITAGRYNQFQLDVKGNLRGVIQDAAGNIRGANVTASNELLVNVNNTVAITANSSVNVAQINGVTPLMGVGATGTGAQRIVIANDAGKTLVSKGGSVGGSGDNTLVVAGTNKLKVYAFSLSTVSTTAVTCIFQSGASGTELWRVILQTPASVAGGANLVVQPPAWLFATASATLLNLNLSAAVTVHWSVSYFDEA